MGRGNVPSSHAQLSVEAVVSRSLHVPTEGGADVAGDVPNASTLEHLIRPVPRGEDIEGSGGSGGLEETHEESHTIDHLGAIVTALDESDDGPESLTDRQVVPGQLGTGDNHHRRDF